MSLRVRLFFALLALSGCTRTTSFLSNRPAADAGGAVPDAGTMTMREAGVEDAQVPEAGVDATRPTFAIDGGVVYCGAAPCICANGLDDDADGLVDGFDPECTGPYDADERTFATGAPGTARTARCEDCFFDDNAGAGDDNCRYPASCSIDGTASGGGGSCGSCDPAPACVNNCLPKTPNGCDCFGCCEVRKGGQTLNVLLNEACSLADIDDVTKCPRCLPSASCRNECGTCELCPGKRLEDLAASCARNPGGYTCDTGSVCGPDRPCGELAYCLLGCCVPIVI